jgi:pimeloyl-ACP methyl ester carboxylesterase
MLAAAPTEFDLGLPSGRLHAQRFGAASAPLVLCVPGLTANMKSFDFLGERLGSDSLQVVALDLRGRGKSDLTPPGSYGMQSHARDMFAAADALGAERFSLIGHSMGGAVALTAVRMDERQRIQRVVLIDLCGPPEPSTGPLISAAVARLGSVYASVEDYLALVRQIGTVSPWSDYFERYLRYELVEVDDGGVRARSSREAVLEDQAQFEGQRASELYALWPFLRQPVLLLRAARELLPGAGYIVSEADRDRFARSVPHARVIEVDANHYGIITADASASAIAQFFA